MIAELGVNVMVAAEINGQFRHQEHLGGRQGGAVSRVAFGKKMQYAVNVRGVANIAELHFKIKHFGNIVHFHRKRRAVRKMIDQGFNLAEVYRSGKYFFHENQSVNV
jgi:hypothetical protein